jgi:tripartite ATP-independent transporter DctP family solute receptor
VKVGATLPADHPTAEALTFFKNRLETLSGGQMSVRLFFSSQLGDATEMLELTQEGSLELAQMSAANIANVIPIANALAMPFIWRDMDHQHKALAGEVGDTIRAAAREHDFRVAAFLDAGTRNITTKTGPIKTPEDLEGLKIRVMNGPLMVDTIEALGASATPMNTGDIYTALQTGMLDGWENNPMTVVTLRMYETGCTYFAWTHHFSIPDVLVASDAFVTSLTAQERAWFDQAVAETLAKQRQLWASSEADMIAAMKSNGMQLNEVDLDPFRQRVAPVYSEYYARYGDEFEALCEHIRSTP